MGVSFFLAACACATAVSSPSPNYRLHKMPVLFSVLDKIRTRYVDPGRIEPKRMLFEALDSMERRVPEILILPLDRKGAKRIQVQVGAQARWFDVSHVRSPWDMTAVLQAIFRFIEPRLHKDTKAKDVEFAAVDGILSTLDPHTILMRPDFLRELEIDTSGHFGGLGIEISVCDGHLTIRRPLPETPAWNTRMKYGRNIYRTQPPQQAAKVFRKNGRWTHQKISGNDQRLAVSRGDEVVRLRAGDRIVRIEDESTVNMTLQESVKRLRGKPGTDVLLWITRKGWKRPRPFLIRRAEIHVPSVTFHDLGNGIGYVRLSKFQSSTGAELRRVLVSHTKLAGLIMDLRDNHGGLLDQAAAVIDLFVQSGTLLAAKESGGIKHIRARRATTVAPKLPLIVLTNEETASAAEIVAAGLKQLNRAVVVGRRTFGKGSVQMIFRTPFHTALKMTISQWLAPGNLSIQGQGLVPDIATSRVRIVKGRPIEYARPQARFRKEKDLKRPLSVPTVKLASKPLAIIRYLQRPVPAKARGIECRYCGQPPEVEQPRDPSVFYKDFHVFLAERLLRVAGRPRRLALLAAAKKQLQTVAQDEDRAIAKKLAEQNIAWDKIPAGHVPPSKLLVDITPRRLRVTAGEKLTIRAKVTNPTKATAYRVRAVIDSTNPFLKGREFLFGTIPPSQTRTAALSVRIPASLGPQKDTVTVTVLVDDRKTVGRTQTIMTVEGRKRPGFTFSYRIIEGAGSDGDGLIEVGEGAIVQLEIANTGRGATKSAYAVLENRSGSAIDVASGRFQVSGLRPGARRTVRFRFRVQKAPRSGLVRFRLRAYDCVMATSLAKGITLRVFPSGSHLTSLRGTASVQRKGATIRMCPDTRCNPLAQASARAGLPLVGKVGTWYVVRLTGTQKGFVEADSVRILQGHPLRKGRLQLKTAVVPPTIHLSSIPLETTTRSVVLRGYATHPDRVADLFVRVSNPKARIYERKAAYLAQKAGKDPRRLSFRVRVPLWPGKNILEVVARQDDEIQQTIRRVILVRSATHPPRNAAHQP